MSIYAPIYNNDKMEAERQALYRRRQSLSNELGDVRTKLVETGEYTFRTVDSHPQVIEAREQFKQALWQFEAEEKDFTQRLHEWAEAQPPCEDEDCEGDDEARFWNNHADRRFR